MLIKKARQRKTQQAQEAEAEAAALAAQHQHPAAQPGAQENGPAPGEAPRAEAWPDDHYEALQAQAAQAPAQSTEEAPPPALAYSPDAVASGLVPERRQRQVGEDRRSSGFYRRLEDQELISQAQEEAQRIREQAYYEGYEQGMAAGQEALQQALEQLQQAMQRLDSARQEAFLSVSDELVPLALAVAEKVLKTEVSLDEQLVVAMAKDLASKVDPEQKQLILKVHPSDEALVKADIEADPTWRFNGREVMVMPDPAVEVGSCMVESMAGQIDGSFTTQLEMVRRLFGLSA